jgi:hypothetical protein
MAVVARGREDAIRAEIFIVLSWDDVIEKSRRGYYRHGVS